VALIELLNLPTTINELSVQHPQFVVPAAPHVWLLTRPYATSTAADGSPLLGESLGEGVRKLTPSFSLTGY
jgi:hypothetical protein